MKKRILLTGGTGFIGRNVISLLSEKYDICAPKRTELNLIDKASVKNYFFHNDFNVIVNCAAANPSKNSLDSEQTMESDIISAFDNLAEYSDKVEKILHLGSGAEYDKNFDIKMAKETEIGRSIPDSPYGRAKYFINEKIRKSKNIYNLRIFGCYGPTDAKSKFIRDAIDCCLDNRAITIRQNCYFDYIYVDDLAKIISWFIDNNPKYHDYNVVSGKPIDLYSIAKIVAEKMENKNGIIIAKEGLNKEYTASNTRLLAEMGNFYFTPIEQGIVKQIEWQRNYRRLV